MSDQALAEELNRRGISVARRTVAKYREALHIPSSNDRCRLA
jgi:RNA polymerase sigma-54 factor